MLKWLPQTATFTQPQATEGHYIAHIMTFQLASHIAHILEENLYIFNHKTNRYHRTIVPLRPDGAQQLRESIFTDLESLRRFQLVEFDYNRGFISKLEL